MVKVLICDPVEVEKLGLDDRFSVDYQPSITREELLSIVGAYEVLLIRSRTKVDRHVLDKAERLRLVARPGTGLDNVDVDYAKQRGIAVINSPESLVEGVAEQVVLAMLALSRNLVTADMGIKAGRWEKNELVGTELKGKILGIVGLGRIGRRIGQIAKAFEMSILVFDVIQIPDDVLAALGARVATLDELFCASDYITLHVPMTDDTFHLVSEPRLAKMKKGSILVNMSRGGVVDEVALAGALREGRIGGAALDVFEKEPPSGPILSAPNTILTPHIGGQTKEAQANAVGVIGEKVKEFFSPHT